MMPLWAGCMKRFWRSHKAENLFKQATARKNTESVYSSIKSAVSVNIYALSVYAEIVVEAADEISNSDL